MRATHLPLCLVSKSLQGRTGWGEQLTQSLASCLSHSREEQVGETAQTEFSFMSKSLQGGQVGEQLTQEFSLLSKFAPGRTGG